MAQDFARRKSSQRKKAPARRKQPAPAGGAGNGLRWYLAGLISGIFASFLLYLGTLPPAGTQQTATTPVEPERTGEQPRPRFDFYTMLPEQSIEDEVVAPQPSAASGSPPGGEYYLLQAGSFRQREDADRRRAELLLLGLEPTIRESTGDNGRWFRVYLGPFQTRSAMSRARSLTAGQNIDTLVLKRSG
jgi:cell division protein FtsN